MISCEDTVLYKAFLDGDCKAFETLVKKYRDQLVSFIYRYVKDIHLAQDVAQEAFVEVFLHKERYNPKYSFKTYLFTIGHHSAVDCIRKNQRYLFVEEALEYLEPVEGLETYVVKNEEKKELFKQLYQCVDYLDSFFHLFSFREKVIIKNKRI